MGEAKNGDRAVVAANMASSKAVAAKQPVRKLAMVQ